MQDPILFTPELMASAKGTQSQYYTSYFQFLIQEDYLEPVRQQLEEDLKKFPSQLLDKTLNLIKIDNSNQSLSAIVEVQTYRRLAEVFNKVEIEPKLEIVGGKTPDFWVDEKYAIEVLAVYEQPPTQERAIINAICEVPTRLITLVRIDGIPEGKNVKLSEIKKHFAELEQNSTSILAKKYDIKRFSDDLIITTQLFAAMPTAKTNRASLVEIRGYEEHEPDYIKAIRNRIIGKLQKYSKLTHSGFPLVLVLYNKNFWMQPDDINQVLFGDSTYDPTTGAAGPTRNGILRADKNTTLSAVLVKQDDIDTPFKLVENPHARVPLSDELRSKINLAFEIK